MIKLILGDWSGDGHNQTEDFMIDCSLTSEELQVAYAKGTKIIGFDFKLSVANDFEEPFIPYTKYVILKDFGIDLSEIDEDEFEEDSDGDITETVASMDTSDYLKIYMGICTLGDPTLSWQDLSESFSAISIGGYGLFS